MTSLSSEFDCSVTWNLTDGRAPVSWEESVSSATTSRVTAAPPSVPTGAPTLLLSAQVSCWTEQGELGARASVKARAVQPSAGGLAVVDMSALVTTLPDGALLVASPVLVVLDDLVPAYDADQHYQPDREE